MASVTESITVAPAPPSTTSGHSSRSFRASWRPSSPSPRPTTRISHWVAEIAGKRHEWDAEITEQSPDKGLAWRALDGHYNSGRVYFEKGIDDNTTKVSVEMEHETEGMVETLGSTLEFDSRQIKADLERFKSTSSRAAPKPAPGAAR